MPILYLFHKSEWAGAAISACELIRHLDRERFRPIAVVPEEGMLAERLRQVGAEVWVAGLLEPGRRGWLRSWRRLGALTARARQAGVGLVHVNYHTVLLWGALLARRLRAPVIVHIRVLAWLSWWERWLLSRCARVVCVSEAARRKILQPRRIDRLLGLPAERIVAISDGRDLAAFRTADGSGVRKEWAVGSDAPLVGIIGNLEPNKGQDRFLEMARVVSRQVPAARFVIVGEVNMEKFRPYADRLRLVCRQEGLENAVRFAGLRRDIEAVIASLDLVVLMSRREAFPGVVLEAMAAGKPVVSTPAEGVVEILGANGAGVVAASHEPMAVAASVVRLLREPVLAQRIGATARRRVEEQFGIERHLEQMSRLYEQCLRRADRPVPRGTTSPAPWSNSPRRMKRS